MRRKIQIGLIGSYSDLKYAKKLDKIAIEIGALVAKSGAILVVGGEKDGGLTKAAAKGAKKNGGIVVGVMPQKENACKDLDVIIQTGGMVGLREYLITIACDALIATNGGSGTLNEITVAYQNNIPVIMLGNCGGWAGKLAGTYLDQRKRYKFKSVRTPKEAVRLAIELAKTK